MNSILDMPEVQSGIVPFIVAMVLALLIGRSRPAWASIGIVPGFLMSAFLMTGLDITPLTGTRKIILMAAIALPFALLLQLYPPRDAVRRTLLLALSLVSALWLVWPVLNRIDNPVSWFPVVLGMVYVVVLVLLFDRTRDFRYASTTALIALGMGTGVSAIVAASALYGQMSISVTNAVAAVLVMSFFSRIKSGVLLTFPASLTLGLLGFATLLFAELPWYTLLLLGLVPVTTQFGVLRNRSDFSGAMLLLVIAVLPALAAIASVWLTAEDSSY